jgi:hypothetical protein
MAKIAKRRGRWVVDWYDPVTKKRCREVCADREAAKKRPGEVLKAGERIGTRVPFRDYGSGGLKTAPRATSPIPRTWNTKGRSISMCIRFSATSRFQRSRG